MTYWGNEVIAHALPTSALSGQLQAPTALPRGKNPRWPLHRRLDGPQSRSKKELLNVRTHKDDDRFLFQCKTSAALVELIRKWKLIKTNRDEANCISVAFRRYDVKYLNRSRKEIYWTYKADNSSHHAVFYSALLFLREKKFRKQLTYWTQLMHVIKTKTFRYPGTVNICNVAHVYIYLQWGHVCLPRVSESRLIWCW
jgi:hypothetical protein